MITGAPWWVYILFCHLFIIGLKATQERKVHLYVLAIAPTIVSCITILRIKANMTLSLVVIYTTSLLIGIYIGWLLVHKTKVQIAHRTITLPGSWQTFIILMSVFAIRFIFGYIKAVQPALAMEYQNIEILLYGSTTGLLIGRTLWYYYRAFIENKSMGKSIQ